MISFFNRIGTSWIAKFIFVVLAISMLAFWGIGGLQNTAGSDGTAIKVGRRSISVAELSKAFDMERAKLSQMTAQYISHKQALEMGLLNQVIQEQVTKELNHQIQEDLGLAASDSAVRRYVERHPVFKDNLGQFDRNLFYAYLTQMKMSETELATQLRNELATQHLTNTLKMVAPTSKILAKMAWQRQNEKRDVEALLIEQDKIEINTQPTEEELKDYYEAYMDQFMTQETRDIQILSLTPDVIAKTITVPESELDALYEEQSANYITPEKRHIYQIRLASQEKANEVRQGLNASNFQSIAKENGQTDNETDFGFVTKSELLPELAEAAFNSNINTVLGPVETSLGWHLLIVNEIQPQKAPNKAKIYAELKEKWIANTTYDALYNKARELEDILGEGKSLQEAAQVLDLPIQAIKNVDMSGKGIPEKLKNRELLQDIFSVKENEVTALTEHENGYLVAEVTAITPVQAQPFADVKDQLKKIWKQEQQKTAFPDLLAKAAEQMKNGVIPAKLGQIIVAHSITQTNPKDIPVAALENIFLQGTGYENATTSHLPNGALISVVKRIQIPEMDTKLLPEQAEKLAAENADTLYSAIIADYADNLGITINTENIQKAFSIYQTE